MRPLWSDPGHASPADLAACREMLRRGSKTFNAAALLLPSHVRERACSLYAFCRLADDAVDLDRRPDALERLHLRLGRAYAGQPLDHPADRALADVVATFAVPRELPAALLEGFAWDAEGRRYETLEDLQAYAARVAGTVGAMMTVLMGARTPGLVARACDLGVAMQLTNIARDVGEDARAGRLYLPLAWLREAGIDPEAWLARPAFSDALGSVVRRLLRAAAPLYARAAHGVAGLPPACRPGIEAARLMYAEIGRELEVGLGLDSVSRRAVVPPGRKLRLLATAFTAKRAVGPTRSEPPLEATRFLVDAVASSPPPADPGPARWWDLGERLAWTLRMLDRVERQRRLGFQQVGE